ncbi:hypothetical protein CTAYLR_002587 [Chrysophaeum taylorii]|uniref:Hexosyltransferase n=1 Tax=Chrysophaeum taylorii TaxID=2483200 RepID=A0AAD7UFN4_9STRA|nr:hypothetical protein CTAYLR_002587 [Chrysophaeum taylorii]
MALSKFAAALLALGESSQEESFGEEEIEEEAAALVLRRAALTESGKKERKAKADKERKARIAAEDEEQCWRAPRPLNELRSVDWDDELRAKSSSSQSTTAATSGRDDDCSRWYSKKDALVTAMEYSEASEASFITSSRTPHPISKVKGVNNRTQLRAVCPEPTCGFLFDVRRRREASGRARWELINFARHDEACGGVLVDERRDGEWEARRERKTAYSAEVLARAVALSGETSRATVKAVLGSLCRAAPSEDLATRVLTTACRELMGKPSDNLQKLAPYLKALRELGWRAELETADADEMNAIVVARARADLKKANKARPREQHLTLDETTLPKAEDGAVYYRGWVVAPPTTQRMLRANLVKRVFAGDFVESDKVDGGSYGVILAYDANSRSIPVVLMHTVENESATTWSRLVREGKAYYGEEIFDSATTVFVVDEVGAAALLQDEEKKQEVLPLGSSRMFLCEERRGEFIADKSSSSSSSSKAAKERYSNFVQATSEHAQRVAYEKFSQTERELVDKVPRDLQCALQNAGLLHKKHTSSREVAEMLEEIRGIQDPVAALVRFVESTEEKTEKSAEEARNSSTIATRAAIDELEELQEAAKRVVTRRVCCPAWCGVCEETGCRERGLIACCPVSGVLAAGRVCGRRREAACSYTSTTTEEEKGRPLTHVALAGDSTVYAGMVTAASSVAATTRAALYAIVEDPRSDAEKMREIEGLKAALACLDLEARVVPYARDLPLRAPTGKGYGNLKSPLNFARFYLANLLPDDVQILVYLDADVVVETDLAAIVPPRATWAIAAVPRPFNVCFDRNDTRPGMFYCDRIGDSRGLTNFNAGVAVFDLAVWRRFNLSQEAETWISRHAQLPLWRLGSNPPLVLIARDRFYPLDPRWNCDGLGWKRPLDLEPTCRRHGAYVWHWSGPRKPWLRLGLYQNLWRPHLAAPHCLTLLPPYHNR